MKLVNPERGFLNEHAVVGVTQITKPHNEKPVGRYKVDSLRDMVELAELLDMETVYAWRVPIDGGEDAHTLVFTPEKDSEIGIAAAGRLEE